MNRKPGAPPELVRTCLEALAAKKAEDIRVLDVRDQSSLTDFLVVATGTSQPHLRALRAALDEALERSGTRIVGVETSEDSGWTVIDAFDVMIHLFTPSQREHFGLENLWKDASEVRAARKKPAPPRKRKAPARKVKRRTRASS